MQKIIISILIFCLTLSSLYLFQEQKTNSKDIQIFQAYQQWKTNFNINYNDENDEEYRFTQFKDTYNFIQEHNSSGDQLVLGLNQFSAMPLDEWFDKFFGGQNNNSKQQQYSQEKYEQNVPEYKSDNFSISWERKGAVIVNPSSQGHCGAGWAFSAAAGLQSLRFIEEGILEQLSVQQLVSCIPRKYLGNGAINGCFGSSAQWGYTYTYNQGIETWDNYPYVSGKFGKVPHCTHNKQNSVFYNDGIGQNKNEQGYIKLPSGDVQAMKERIKIQPFSGAINAHSRYFKNYQKGVFRNQFCKPNPNHSVFIVGIKDYEDRMPYWNVQNSLGPYWGENGYFRIEVTEGKGVCGINMENYAPISSKQQQQNIQ